MSVTTRTTVLLDTLAIEAMVTESLRFGDCQLRQPDGVDPVLGTAFWIGADACVEVPFERLDALATLARDWAPRTRPEPETLGIMVVLHNPEYVHPAFSTLADPIRAHRSTLWAEFAEVLTAA